MHITYCLAIGQLYMIPPSQSDNEFESLTRLNLSCTTTHPITFGCSTAALQGYASCLTRHLAQTHSLAD